MIAERLKEKRLEAGLSEIQLAEKASVRPRVVFRLEKESDFDIHASELLIVAQALEISFFYLIEKSDNPAIEYPEFQIGNAGKNLKQIREILGISAVGLAEMSGLSVDTILLLEYGHIKDIRVHQAILLSEVLGVPLVDILDGRNLAVLESRKQSQRPGQKYKSIEQMRPGCLKKNRVSAVTYRHNAIQNKTESSTRILL